MASGEFDIIEKLFAPLTSDAPGAFSLKDDAALLSAQDYVVTKDVLISGVHFFPSDPLGLVARKALRVNLSDLAAKGAKPVGYLLGCVWPAAVSEDKIADFVAGLRSDQDEFRISLFGGDTCVHKDKKAPLTISVTMFGTPPRDGVTRRNGAKSGDDVYVTGAIGDAGLALAVLEKRVSAPRGYKEFLLDRFQLPRPRVSIGGALGGIAHASIDVSDGLAADAGHMASASGVAIELQASLIPVSDAVSAWIERDGLEHADAIAQIVAWGDDYEILFAAPGARRRAIQMASQVTKTPVTRIGRVTKGAGVKLLDDNGSPITIKTAGFDHFD
ncbi:MAG: thiamine-phosphate kinase [Parvularculaceae bacterium]